MLYFLALLATVSWTMMNDASAQRGPLANPVVPPHSHISLPVPLGEDGGRLIQSLLQRANVPFGLERPADEPTTPLNAAAAPEHVITFGGLRVGDALDAIAKEDPRYTWSEADGRIVVRTVAVGGTSALDLRVGRFEVRNGTLENAVAALIALVDARRPAPRTVHFSASFTSGPVSAPKPPPATRRSVVFDGGTLEQLLNALGRPHGRSSTIPRVYASRTQR